MKTRLWPDSVAIVDKAPRNGTVVAVGSNTDCLYQGDETRKRKYDYRPRRFKGIAGSAATTSKYYQ